MKTTLKIMATLALAATLNGCAVTYTLEDQKYSSKEEFQQAADRLYSNAIASIAPMPAPLTSKRLIVGIPKESVMQAESTRRFVEIQKTQPIGNAKEILENITRSNYKGMRSFFEVAQKANIYSSVQLVELDSMNGSVEPAPNADAVYFVEPARGSAQWYYASAKHGKQIFAYDRSAPGPTGKAHGFRQALQAQAIRE